MHTINPRYIQARRRADRLAMQFSQPHLTSPTIARRGLTPRVDIGCLRDPSLPIEIFPTVHTPPRKQCDVEFWAMVGSFVGAVWMVAAVIGGN